MKFLTFFLALSSFISANVVLEAFYNPQCGCCHKYFKKLEKEGFTIKRNPIPYRELVQLKAYLGIPLDKRSCHTMLTKDGKVIEGHVPPKAIKEALKKKDVRGVYSPHGHKSAAGEYEEDYEFFK
ncbi:DUF411 domain-containing protein [Aquifex pyrophilus]